MRRGLARSGLALLAPSTGAGTFARQVRASTELLLGAGVCLPAGDGEGNYAPGGRAACSGPTHRNTHYGKKQTMIPRRHRQRIGLFFASLGAPAMAAEGQLERDESREHLEHREHGGGVLSMRIAYVESLERRSAEENEEIEEGAPRPLTRHSAVGLGYEHTVLPGWLSVQAGALLFFGVEGGELPASLTLEMPIELSESTELYFGGGLTADLVREDRFSPHFGLSSVAGVYAWATSLLGANVEVESRWVPSANRVYDLTVAVGAAARF